MQPSRSDTTCARARHSILEIRLLGLRVMAQKGRCAAAQTPVMTRSRGMITCHRKIPRQVGCLSCARERWCPPKIYLWSPLCQGARGTASLVRVVRGRTAPCPQSRPSSITWYMMAVSVEMGAVRKRTQAHSSTLHPITTSGAENGYHP